MTKSEEPADSFQAVDSHDGARNNTDWSTWSNYRNPRWSKGDSTEDQALSQLLQAFVDPFGNRAARHAGRLGYLVMGLAFEVTKDERHPILFRQPLQLLPEHMAPFLLVDIR